VVCDDGDMHAGALTEDEAGEGGFPAGLVGKCVAQVEADAHGKVEMLKCR
jgi:hypothetical protein